MGVFLRLVLEVMFPTGRAPEVGVLKGDVSRPRSVSTYLMGVGLILLAVGFFIHPLILLAGVLVFVIGLLLAVIEAIFEK